MMIPRRMYAFLARGVSGIGGLGLLNKVGHQLSLLTALGHLADATMHFVDVRQAFPKLINKLAVLLRHVLSFFAAMRNPLVCGAREFLLVPLNTVIGLVVGWHRRQAVACQLLLWGACGGFLELWYGGWFSGRGASPQYFLLTITAQETGEVFSCGELAVSGVSAF